MGKALRTIGVISIFLIVLLVPFILSVNNFFLMFNNSINHQVFFCDANGNTVCTTDNYYDNSENITKENSMTIDNCTDGAITDPAYLQQTYYNDYKGYDEKYSVWYQYVRGFSRIDRNNSKEGDVNETVLRGKDNVELIVNFMCPSYDNYYAVLYKNNTEDNTSWRFLGNGYCVSSDPEGYSSIVDKIITFALDDKPGNHTVRAFIIYPGPGVSTSGLTCGSDPRFNDPSDPESLYTDFSDTDDLVMEVIESLDREAPVITFNSPVENNHAYELDDQDMIWINTTISDRTGVDSVNCSLVYYSLLGNVSTNYNCSNQSYLINNTNTSKVYAIPINISSMSLGTYDFIFSANDTIRTNSTIGTLNHKNNITSIRFRLQNEKNINITSPLSSENHIYTSRIVLLNFVINDKATPYNEVSFTLNGDKTILNDSVYYETVQNNTLNFVNNSLSNLSQSFNLSKSIDVMFLSLYLKKNGDQNINSTLFLINDSEGLGLNGEMLANATFSGVDNQSFGWVKIMLDRKVALSSGKIYWIKLMAGNESEYLDWSYAVNNYSGGVFYDNNSLDLSLRVFDLYDYAVNISAIEGENTVDLFENDSSSAVRQNSRKFTVDTVAPYFDVPIYNSTFEAGVSSVIKIAAYDDTSGIKNSNGVLLSFNGTNRSMTKSASFSNGGNYTYSLNVARTGNYNFSIYTLDSAGFSNRTLLYNFSVNDTVAPSTSYVYSPLSVDDIDPNVTIYFNITLSDYSNISSVIFQYRSNTSGIYTNKSAARVSAYFYTVNFTPDEETLYFYKIIANDSFGNSNINASVEKNVTVGYERKFTVISPSKFIFPVLMSGNGSMEIYNFTVNNTGDVSIFMNITYYSPDSYVQLNYSNNSFLLEINQSMIIFVNSTLPDPTFGSSSDVTTYISSPGALTKTASIIGSVARPGDYPIITINIDRISGLLGEPCGDNCFNLFYYPPNYNSTAYKFKATIKNSGGASADNVTLWFNYTNPSLWIRNNLSLQNLSSNFNLTAKDGGFENNSLEIFFYLDTPKTQGSLFDINALSTFSSNGSVYNKSSNIKINSTKYDFNNPPVVEICGNGIDDNNNGEIDEGCVVSNSGGGGTDTQTESTPQIGGGGGPTGGAGGGLGGGLTLNYNLSIFNEKNIDLFRGTNKTIQINISNHYKNKYFSNISLSVFGYYQNYITFFPKKIERLNFNETKTINITFVAPSYLGYSVNNVKLNFDYLAVSFGLNESSGDKMSQSSQLNLIINEVSRDDSISCLEKSSVILKNATLLNYSTHSLKQKFEYQKSAIFSLDFTKASKLCVEIKNDFEKIVSYQAQLNDIQLQLSVSIGEGYSLNDVERLFNISKNQFSIGEYEKLENSIKDVKSAYALQLKIEDSDFIRSQIKFLKNYWKESLVFILVLLAVFYYVWKTIQKLMVKQKIIDLDKEKVEIDVKLKELQDKYYSKKDVSSDYFTLHTSKYKDRVAEISDELLHYKSKFLKFERNAKTKDALLDKELKLKAMISDIQKQYYIDKSIDKRSFEKSVESYNKNLSNVKKQIFILKSKNENSPKGFFNNLKLFFLRK